MIVGWQLATHLRTSLALDALEMAIWARHAHGADLAGLVHHSDRGSQYRAVRYTERLADAGAVASVGSRGDSYDNSMAESVNGLFKTELYRPRGPWRGLNDLELAAMDYIDWFNHRRLHGELGLIPPADKEALYYRHHPGHEAGQAT
jgi:putative transposase